MVSAMFPWKSLNATARRALACHILWAFGQALADSFVNVYLFRLGAGYRPVIEFQLVRAIFIPIGFSVAAWIARRSSTAQAYRIGVLSFLVFFLAILILRDASVNYVLWLGAWQGFAIGLYWLAWGIFALELTGDSVRDQFLSTGLLGLGVVSMLGGPAAGWILSRWIGLQGYFWLFLLAFCVFFSSAILSLSLTSKPLPAGKLKYIWRIRHPKGWPAILWTSLASGVRDGVLAYLVGLLVYEVSASEAKLGLFNGTMAFLGLIGATLAGRLLSPGKRRWWMLAGACGIALGTAGLAWKVSLSALIVYGTCVALLGPAYQVAYGSTQYKIMGQSRRLMARRADYLIYKEWPIAAGRVLSNLFLLFFLVDARSASLRWVMVMIGLIPLASSLYLAPHVDA
jgi:YQGE family putative transporter